MANKGTQNIPKIWQLKKHKTAPRPKKMAGRIKSRRIGGLEVPIYNAYVILIKCQKLILPISSVT